MTIYLNTNLMTLSRDLVDIYNDLKAQKRGSTRRLQRLLTRYSDRNRSFSDFAFQIADIPKYANDTCLSREDYEKLGAMIRQNNSAQVSFCYVDQFDGTRLFMTVKDPKGQNCAYLAVWTDLLITVLDLLMEERNHERRFLLDDNEEVGKEYAPVESVFQHLKDFVKAYHPHQLEAK